MEDNNSTTQTNSKNKKWTRRFWAALPTLILFMLVGVVVVLFGWIQTQANAIKEEKSKALRHDVNRTNVVALEMVPGLVQDRLNLPGVIKPWVELNAVAEVNGMISEKRVAKGEYVKKGDILAAIDNRDYENSYASAKAAYNAAKTTFERLNLLLKNKAASQAQVDEARAHQETSKAAMANAKLRLERTVIRSPLSGVVDETFIENGQYVNPGQQIAKILQIDRIKVEVGIPESDVDAVRGVENFTVTIDALNGKVFQGKFFFLSKTAQSMARLYNLEIAVDNPEGEILPDMFTRVDIVKQKVSDGLAVPLFSLVRHKDGGDAVYVAENGLARLQGVETGIQEGWLIQITKGLKSGDKVVVVGHRDLNDNMPVKVVRTVHNIEEINQ